MRKITELAVSAFYGFESFKSGNTQVIIDEDGTAEMLLHGNRIAILPENGKGVAVGFGGWDVSTTTKERLNGVLGKIGGYVYTRKGVTYIECPNVDVIEVKDLDNLYMFRR